MARGETVLEAAKSAGFRWPGYGRRIADDPDIVGRVEFLRRRLGGAGSRDCAYIIDKLMDQAHAAASIGSAQGFQAARALYELAAKLKAGLPADPAEVPSAPVFPLDERLTDEEWMARYGPDPPGGKCSDWKPSEP
ncbi:MAG TPA: hypothetical protein VGS12_07620 [Caulobacteraceae bacterium]|nr:hypothetical protein [Caulobacteraceae bacterium]